MSRFAHAGVIRPVDGTGFLDRPRHGTPVKVNVVGPTVLFTPSSGKSVRLFWVGLGSPDTNTQTVIATISIGSTPIFIWPMGIPGVFSRETIREGQADEVLKISLSAGGQDVYVNIDVEDF